MGRTSDVFFVFIFHDEYLAVTDHSVRLAFSQQTRKTGRFVTFRWVKADRGVDQTAGTLLIGLRMLHPPAM